MTFQHGKRSTFYFNGFDGSPFFRKLGIKPVSQSIECTPFAADSKAFIPGLKDGTWMAEGWFEGSADSLDEVLRPLLGAEALVLCLHVPGAESAGKMCLAWQSLNTQHENNSAPGAAVDCLAGGQISDDLDVAVLLLPKATQTEPDNGATHDNGASSTGGAVAHLHIPELDGDDLTAKIEHSDDGSSWSDLLVFAEADSAVWSERKTIASGVTIKRYTRPAWTGTFTSATPVIAFSRK